MNKIIAFSLWGDNPKYTIGAIRNVEIAKELFPDWICRIYYGDDVPEDIINRLTSLGAATVCMGRGEWNGMFWRFYAADGDEVMISRDTDSRLGQREKAAIDEWLSSDKDFHIMRDHPYHATEIMGGMWGSRNGVLKGIKDMIASYDKGNYDNKYQVDQNFLREVVYPLVKNNSLVHDEFFDKIPFPKSAKLRTNEYFVGQVYDENDKPEFN
jgi:hypothetical protein